MISLSNITVKFGDETILDNFSLDFPEHGSCCLFAPSGGGKTTILRLLSGLQKADSDAIHGLENKKIAVLFQEDRLLPQLSALDNIKLVLPQEKRSEALVWLERLGLKDSAHKTPLQLSGGMQRRLAIARSLAYGAACSADIYLLDEPFRGLDESTLNHCLTVVKEAVKDSLLILVTHRREEAEVLCDRIVVLGGRPLKIFEDTVVSK